MSIRPERKTLSVGWSRWLAFSIAATVVSGTACTKSDSGGGHFDTQNAPYGERTATTANQYTLKKSDGTTVTLKPTKSGTKTVGSQTYDRYTFPDLTDPSVTTDYWISGPTADGALVIGGGSKGTTKTAQLDSPLTVKLVTPVGQAETVSGSATVTTPSFPSGSKAQGTGQVTLAETNTTVETTAGQVNGVYHYHATGSFTGAPVPSQFQGKPLTGEAYYHPSYGLVAASSPELGWSVGLAESSDCGEVDSSGYRLIKKVGVVDGTKEFDLDTYTCAGNNFDADKNTHAAMLLELRWLDEATAKTTNEPGYPMIDVEFGTVIGVFSAMMTQSSTSIFHPEENGKGYVFWYGYVNQAAKNEAGSNGIAYHITVREDPGFSAVRATGRIYYKTVP